MVTVYAIFSELNGNIYVGMAIDPDRRLKEHNSGKSNFTKKFRPWKTIYREIHKDWATARTREKYFKTGIGKEFLRSMVP
ncbi:MAG: GIY-YIG nuclease family protein [Dinghuibacter sp.]|nr:GIY-YIG nuclease family protein [Dinghuibacter sp.]